MARDITTIVCPACFREMQRSLSVGLRKDDGPTRFGYRFSCGTCGHEALAILNPIPDEPQGKRAQYDPVSLI